MGAVGVGKLLNSAQLPESVQFIAVNPAIFTMHTYFWASILREDGLSCVVAEVVRRLSMVAESEAVVSANPQHATRLRQSILQKAFT